MNKERQPFTRGTYWLHVFMAYIIGLFAISALSRVTDSEYVKVVYIFMTIYWIIIEIRRFHDANKRAWPVLLNIIPGIGTMIALIYAGVLKPNYDNNRWYPHLKPRKKGGVYAEADDSDYDEAIDVDYEEVKDTDYEEAIDVDYEEVKDADYEEVIDVDYKEVKYADYEEASAESDEK